MNIIINYYDVVNFDIALYICNCVIVCMFLSSTIIVSMLTLFTIRQCYAMSLLSLLVVHSCRTGSSLKSYQRNLKRKVQSVYVHVQYRLLFFFSFVASLFRELRKAHVCCV